MPPPRIERTAKGSQGSTKDRSNARESSRSSSKGSASSLQIIPLSTGSLLRVVVGFAIVLVVWRMFSSHSGLEHIDQEEARFLRLGPAAKEFLAQHGGKNPGTEHDSWPQHHDDPPVHATAQPSAGRHWFEHSKVSDASPRHPAPSPLAKHWQQHHAAGHAASAHVEVPAARARSLEAPEPEPEPEPPLDSRTQEYASQGLQFAPPPAASATEGAAKRAAERAIAKYLEKSMESYLKHRPDAELFPIWVSQDSSDAAVAELLASYLHNGYIARHWRFQPDLPPGPAHYPSLYHRLASHYKFALEKVFIEEAANQVVILEDDLEVAPDFFGYFAATLPLLRSDPDLFCVSAWNDNGKTGIATDHRALLRTDFFPGLGWMLLRSLWMEVRETWPPAYWDDFVRTPDVRQGRHCIHPEVSRTRTFGEVGASKGQFFHTHLAKIVLGTEHIDWASEDLNYVATAENFDAYLSERIQQAGEPVPFNQLVAHSSPRGGTPEKSVVTVMYADSQYQSYAKRLGLMEDEKAGIRRGSYRGVLTFTWRAHRVYLVRDWPLHPLPQGQMLHGADQHPPHRSMLEPPDVEETSPTGVDGAELPEPGDGPDVVPPEERLAHDGHGPPGVGPPPVEAVPPPHVRPAAARPDLHKAHPPPLPPLNQRRQHHHKQKLPPAGPRQHQGQPHHHAQGGTQRHHAHPR
eukprot:CAMPEP_0178408684 /NCGR_PEP_ID=MMETSP0689_2-20121128/20069_1 /TAXON_ID=160604 /ORGANISM="Amphidinium massartii, Strain CS-259" /LENGTH=689 /DNA_ID=CAMNT_0020029793 /DNA_START=1 /DNA_END=2069 /DNA_ORIENTATION=+